MGTGLWGKVMDGNVYIAENIDTVIRVLRYFV